MTFAVSSEIHFEREAIVETSVSFDADFKRVVRGFLYFLAVGAQNFGYG